MLPPPDDGGEEDEDGDDEGEGGGTWADEGYQRADDAPAATSGALWIGVLPQNVGVVQVFQRCQPQIGIGMGVLWQGVGAVEVLAACRMSHVRKKDWPRTLDGVQLMARTVADIRNDEEARRAKAKKK